MTVKITIKDVPKELRDRLAARAAFQGQSMQQFLLGQLTRIASRPSVEEWLREVRLRKEATKNRVTLEAILRARYADRA